MIRNILYIPFFVITWLILRFVDEIEYLVGITRLRSAEESWIRDNGEIPDGHCLDCGWKVGATGTIEEYRCELRRVGSTGPDLPFSY